MEELLLEQNYQRVVYLGDGRGDFCPCTRLGPNDYILARQHYPDGSSCALLPLLVQQGATVCENSLRPHQQEVGQSSNHSSSSSNAGRQSYAKSETDTKTHEESFPTAVQGTTMQTPGDRPGLPEKGCDNRRDMECGQSGSSMLGSGLASSKADACSSHNDRRKDKQDAEGLDQARYQGTGEAVSNVDQVEALPPPPPKPSGLHTVSSGGRHWPHLCVASVHSWSSAAAAADMLRELL